MPWIVADRIRWPVRRTNAVDSKAIETVDRTQSPPIIVPIWLRYLFPSVADLIFVVLLLILSCSALSSRLLGDAGIGWHIRNGALISETHSITCMDPFSSTMGGKTWYAWEWLYDVLVARVHGWLGLNGVVLFAALCIAFAFALAFRLATSASANLPLATLLILLSVGASTIHFLARPHVLSWLFVVFWFLILDSSERNPERRWRLFWMPVLTPLWANLHGGFLTGFVLCGCYLTGAVLAGPTARIPKYLRALIVATALTLLASLINPYGYHLYVHIYRYLSNQFLMNHIDEFLSPNFHGVAQQCFLILLLLTIAGLAIGRERLRPSHFMVLLFAVFSGLYASRNLPVSSILLTLINAPILTEAIAATAENPAAAPWVRRHFERYRSFMWRMKHMEMSLNGHLWPLAAFLMLLWTAAHGGTIGAHQLMNAQFDAKRFPVQAVKQIAQIGIHEPIFCPDYWGGYLIYNLYPQTKVVADDRHDLYGEQFFKDYLRTVRAEPGWDSLLENHHVSRVLAPSDSALANVLKEMPQWRSVYRDDVAELFERVQ